MLKIILVSFIRLNFFDLAHDWKERVNAIKEAREIIEILENKIEERRRSMSGTRQDLSTR